MVYKKTAKDLAWDREREKLRREKESWIHLCAEKEQNIQYLTDLVSIQAEKIAKLEKAINLISEGKYTSDQLLKHMENTNMLMGLLKYQIIDTVPEFLKK